jgi:hypothetical protein
MSRTRENSQAFRAAEIQSRRAERAEERLAQQQKELTRLRAWARSCELTSEQAAAQRCALQQERDAAIRDLTAIHAAYVPMQHNLARVVVRVFGLERQLAAAIEMPMWRIAANRLRLWMKGKP